MKLNQTAPVGANVRARTCGRPRNKWKRAPDGRQCADCSIRIFRSAAEAEDAGRRFQLHINGAVGDRCFGCATSEMRLSAEEEHLVEVKLNEIRARNNGAPKKHKEKRAMKKDEPIFTQFEEAVEAPPAYKGRQSKYQPILDKVLEQGVPENGEDSWSRFKMATPKLATGAHSFLKKHQETVKAQGFTVYARTTGNDDGTAWLYVQRRPYENGEESETKE